MIVFTAQDFYESIDRMRCFSIALDPAGVRFSLVLILIAATIVWIKGSAEQEPF